MGIPPDRRPSLACSIAVSRKLLVIIVNFSTVGCAIITATPFRADRAGHARRLAAKDAILIVEFAKMKSEQGLCAIYAATEFARDRFWPILMRAFSFALGVNPLIAIAGPVDTASYGR